MNSYLQHARIYQRGHITAKENAGHWLWALLWTPLRGLPPRLHPLSPAGGVRSVGGINELLGVCIFGPHAVIAFFDLEGPGGEVCGQDGFEAEAESQGGWIGVGP
jgi:hypothetical protein